MKQIMALLLTVLSALALQADDAEANQYMKEGFERMESGSYASAADKFKAAELMADATTLKAGALTEAIKAYREAGMLYKEYESIERMLESYPAHADYPALVKREFEIGDSFRTGYREPAFAALSWVPWLKGNDKSPEIYEQAVKRAPFSEGAPAAKLELALHNLKNFKTRAERNKGLELLRELIKQYPNTRECYWAYINLADALFQLSENGDGDGAYNREAISVLEEFLVKYPDSPEADYLKTMLMRSKDRRARNLLGVAEFYQRMEKKDAAERYLNTVLKEYSDTASARDAEALLVDLDRTFTPDRTIPFETPERLQSYQRYELPVMYEEMLIAPENSDGKWLVPIYDLNLPDRSVKTADKEEGADQ